MDIIHSVRERSPLDWNASVRRLKTDPLNFSDGKEANFFGDDLDTLKIKELKHCRLAMLAWLGILAQSVSTNPEGTEIGPVANWSAHVADVVHCNVVDRSGCVF